MKRKPFKGVAVCAPVSCAYVRHAAEPAAYFIGQALRGLLQASGLEKSAIDGLSVTSMTLAPDTVAGLVEHFGMRARWLAHLPFGGASAVVGAIQAARAVQAGDADIVAVIGGETNSPETFARAVESFSGFSAMAVWPHGAPGPNGPYALITQAYMDAYGATRSDFGRLAVEQRGHAQGYDHAMLRTPLSLEHYLAARPIAPPIHLYDCVLPCAGAEGFLVMRAARARRLGLPYAELAGAEQNFNAFAEDVVQLRGGWAEFADTLYAMAGAGPEAMDALYTYDDYPVMSFIQMEDLGFCEKGGAGAWFAGARLTAAGRRLLHNTSGGQLSAGQAGFAGGHLGFVEALRQAAGVAGPRQLPIERALVSGYGMVNYDRGVAASAAILTRGAS